MSVMCAGCLITIVLSSIVRTAGFAGLGYVIDVGEIGLGVLGLHSREGLPIRGLTDS